MDRQEALALYEEVFNHCRDCKFFRNGFNGYNEYFECTLLWEELLAEAEEQGDDLWGDEGIFAVAEYDHAGNLMDFYLLDSYPKGCPVERNKEKNNG